LYASTPTGYHAPVTSVSDRRQFMAYLAGLHLSSALRAEMLNADVAAQDPPRITRQMIADAVRVAGDSLKDAEHARHKSRTGENRDEAQAVRGREDGYLRLRGLHRPSDFRWRFEGRRFVRLTD
jgi:hypothetical protein